MGRLLTAEENARINEIGLDAFAREASDERTITFRAKIDATNEDLPALSKQAWAALIDVNDPPVLFRFGAVPTRLEAGDNGEPVTRALDFDRMRYHLARAAEFTKLKGRGEHVIEAPVAPPESVVKDVLATPDQPLPVLTRIVEAPVFAPDGTLQTTPGYHSASQTYFAPAAGFTMQPVPDRPTGEDIEAARTIIIDELLHDFPFVSDAERSHAVALLLLPFARDLIDDPTPLHLIEKPTPGTGATLLVDMLAWAATGRPIATMTEGRDEEEWRKRITAKLRTGSAFLLIDNLRRELDSAAVSSAITSKSWQDRLLGFTEMVDTPVRCAWVATGNNPRLSTEITRRTVRIRLDARIDRPWLRNGFRHANLREWVVENRSLIVWAALTLIKAWIAAGKPKGKTTLGMFERWAETMGGILQVAGIPGFLENASGFYDDSDAEGVAWRTLLSAWLAKHGTNEVTVRALWEIATAEGCIDLGDKGEQSQRIRLGKLLSDRRERVYDLDQQQAVIRRGDKINNATQWRLQIASQ